MEPAEPRKREWSDLRSVYRSETTTGAGASTAGSCLHAATARMKYQRDQQENARSTCRPASSCGRHPASHLDPFGDPRRILPDRSLLQVPNPCTGSENNIQRVQGYSYGSNEFLEEPQESRPFPGLKRVQRRFGHAAPRGPKSGHHVQAFRGQRNQVSPPVV